MEVLELGSWLNDTGIHRLEGNEGERSLGINESPKWVKSFIMGRLCFCSYLKSPVKPVVTSIASLFTFDCGHMSLVCWNVTVREPWGQPGGFPHQYTCRHISCTVNLWVDSPLGLLLRVDPRHIRFGQDGSLCICSGLHSCSWGQWNFLKPTWALEVWDQSQHAFSEQDTDTQHDRLLEYQRGTETVEAMALLVAFFPLACLHEKKSAKNTIHSSIQVRALLFQASNIKLLFFLAWGPSN